MDSLPLVLLGIRTALKEDTNCTSAEMGYDVFLENFAVPPPILLRHTQVSVEVLHTQLRPL